MTRILFNITVGQNLCKGFEVKKYAYIAQFWKQNKQKQNEEKCVKSLFSKYN